MNLNNNGLSSFKTIAFIIIVGAVGFLAAPTLSKYMEGSKLTTFIAYEDNMEEAAKNAVLDCVGNNSSKCELPSKGGTNSYKLSYLINEGLIGEINDPKGGKCDYEKSFVKVENRGNLNYKFKVCLYCDNYTSDNDICK
jgi:hypothetical protein